MPRSDEASSYLSPTQMATGRPRWQSVDLRGGMARGGFLEWPALRAGVIGDSNPLQEHRSRRGDVGLQIAPSLVVERETSVHATAAYADGRARLYGRETRANVLDGRAGLIHDWALAPDFILRGQVDVTRARDRIDNPQAVTGVSRARPFTATDLAGVFSAQKTFDRSFLSATALIRRESFDESASTRTAAGERALSDQTVTTAKIRAGYALGPALFAFAEPSANWRVLDRGDMRSHGSRGVAGLAIDRDGLLTGEAYAGFAEQTYDRRSPRTVTEPVFGGRMAWTPTPIWTASLRFHRSLEQAAVATVSEPIGTPTKIETGALEIRYRLDQRWTATADVEATSVDYLGTPRRDRLLTWGTVLAFGCWHGLDLDVDLHVTRVKSSIAVGSYDRATAAVVAVYRY